MTEQPNPNPEPQGGAAQPQGTPSEPAPQPSDYDNLMQKKGFADNNALAKSYGEAESTLGRTQSAQSTTKAQLEKYGYSLDDKGNVVTQNGQPIPAQQGGQQQPYPQQQPDTQEAFYDPYTNQQLTDPVDIQLAKLPPSQRISAVVNVMAQQREKMQGQSFDNEQEILNAPEAKGFENDVRSVMARLPLETRSKKESWSDALLKVKGAKYDEAMKNAGNQGVDEFINKAGVQPIPAAGAGAGAAGNVKLTAEQEASFAYYKQNQPGMFRDKAHFLSRTKPSGE